MASLDSKEASREYTEHEAKDAYDRVVKNYNWGNWKSMH